MKLALGVIILASIGVSLHTYHTIHNVDVMNDVNVIERQNSLLRQ